MGAVSQSGTRIRRESRWQKQQKDQHDTCQGADTVPVRYCHGIGDSI